MNEPDPPQWPRSSSGTEAQHLLLTLLGDYWHARTELLPSAALVSLLAELGVTESSARQAMRRLIGRGLLVQERVGRATFYGIPPRITGDHAARVSRALTFGERAVEWDGTWTVVVTSVPERDREIRHQLRNRLRAMRFGLFYDAVWISPHDVAEQAEELLDELGIVTGAVMRAGLLPRRAQDSQIGQVFGLEEVASRYLEFIERHERDRDRLRRPGPPRYALRTRTNLMSEWLSFRAIDPELPVELLPDGWPRPAARALFVEVYDALGGAAEARFREIVAASDPELAKLAQHHTSRSAAQEEVAGAE